MTKQRKAQILTVAALAAGFGFVLARNANWKPRLAAAVQPKPDPTPQDAIYAMLDAAREGDVQKYLACYTGQMEAELQQALLEKTEPGFSRYLKDFNAPIKGVAITEPQALSDREVKVQVEYVYQDRNEAQFFYLEKQGAEWKIARVDSAERVKTLVPYGTPVQ